VEVGDLLIGLLLAVLGGLLPTVFYVLFVWWLDRYEKEPVLLLATAFVWGAVPAAILSVGFELLLDLPLIPLGNDSLAANLMSVTLFAPLVEETCKGIALIGLVVLFHREFDDVLDGIVYGAMIGFGFALTENVFGYFIPILLAEGVDAALSNIFLRSILFGLNHAFWTATMGAAVGLARLTRGWCLRILIAMAGWSLAVTFHAIHNLGAMLVEQTGSISLMVSLMFDMGGLLVLLLVAMLSLRKERAWIEAGLEGEIERDALTSQEIALLRSATRRMRARLRAWDRGGRQAYHDVGRYFQCATELAFKRYQLLSFDEEVHLAEIRRLQDEFQDQRAKTWTWLWPASP
jgi:RsiW-degrading membrane proteinase PrsW (M82 family)